MLHLHLNGDAIDTSGRSNDGTISGAPTFGASPIGSAISLSEGCDLSPETCRDKFDNIINYGGAPFVPSKNIFRKGVI